LTQKALPGSGQGFLLFGRLAEDKGMQHAVTDDLRRRMKQAGLGPVSTLLVAVSGGLDSVVLLDLLVQLAVEFGYQLHVFHLDHQLRSQSRIDAAFVRQLCKTYGLPDHIATADVQSEAQNRGLSLEMAGRILRRQHLLALAQHLGATRILLAHHRDDQAETFLLRLLRGTGTKGLQAMCEYAPPWWRPLLHHGRQQLLAYARCRQLTWVEDHSNADLQFQRNRVRHQLLPLMRKENPRISEGLGRLCQQLQQDEDYWQQQLALIWPRLVIESSSQGRLSSGCELRLARDFLLTQHPALQVRLLRAALAQVRGHLQGIEAVHLEALRALLAADRAQAEVSLPGCWAARRYQTLWLRPTAPEISSFNFWLYPGDSCPLPDGRRLHLRCETRSQGEDFSRVEFDFEQLQFPLQLRSPQPGESFIPSGMTGHSRLKKYLIDHKVEKEQRRQLPLLLHQDQILWLVGLRRAALAPVTDDQRKILVASLENPHTVATNCL